MQSLKNTRGIASAKGFLILNTLLVSLSTGINAEAASPRLKPLIVTAQPASTTIYEGQSTTFSISATSSKSITYYWYKDGVRVGSNSSSLSINNATVASAGSYSCKVTDGTKNFACNSFSLGVNEIVRIVDQPSNQMVNEGTGVSLSVTATGTPPISYQWYYNDQAISGSTTATINIAETILTDAGNYYCKVNNAGSSTDSAIASLMVMDVPITGSAYLSWSQPALREDGTTLDTSEISGYNLYYSNDSETSMSQIATLSASDLSYVVGDLPEGTHYFSISAVDVEGFESSHSPTLSKTIK